MVGHNLVMCGSHWSSASGDIMYLICHVTSQKHAELFMVCHHLTKFDSHRFCIIRDIVYLVCHVTKQDHMIKRSGYYKDRSPSR